MTKIEDIRMPLTSHDVVQDRMDRLRELFPEVFCEGKIDFDRLRRALGESIDNGRERYGLTWAGKADAIRAIQSPSVGTLVPCPEESVNFDTTENLFIEGDNLEVLKLLQKSYYGRVKMIYIDPPYNTGNEFIYPDNYREGLEDYLRYSGQVDDAGVRQSTNTETSGRYHSKWLTMMYPRLFLARNLLREDGVIFVSIDDHEVHNLRLIMNEVFGEENFIAMFVRKRRMATGMRGEPVSPDHEYVVAFGKSRPDSTLFGSKKEESDYPFEDAQSKYRSTDLTVGMNKDMRPNQFYAIKNPRTGCDYWPPEDRVWRFQPSTMQEEIAKDNIIWPDDNPDRRMSRPRYKTRFRPDEAAAKTTPVSTWIDTRGYGANVDGEDAPVVLTAGMNQEGTKELRELFGAQVMEYPKPQSLLRTLVRLATRENDLVLDFFAGSCTTAHAVWEVNREDGGARRFVMVQLPEPTDESSTAKQAGYSTIAAIGKDRLCRAAKRLTAESGSSIDFEGRDASEDLGFRVFKLTSSNFKIWSGDEAPKDAEALGKQLRLFADHVDHQRSQQDILYELILKADLPLTTKIDTKTVAGQPVFSIADGMLLICLANPITQECLRGMIALNPQRVICLDPAFKGNDQLKTNTVLEMKSHGITFRTV